MREEYNEYDDTRYDDEYGYEEQQVDNKAVRGYRIVIIILAVILVALLAVFLAVFPTMPLTVLLTVLQEVAQNYPEMLTYCFVPCFPKASAVPIELPLPAISSELSGVLPVFLE